MLEFWLVLFVVLVVILRGLTVVKAKELALKRLVELHVAAPPNALADACGS